VKFKKLGFSAPLSIILFSTIVNDINCCAIIFRKAFMTSILLPCSRGIRNVQTIQDHTWIVGLERLPLTYHFHDWLCKKNFPFCDIAKSVPAPVIKRKEKNMMSLFQVWTGFTLLSRPGILMLKSISGFYVYSKRLLWYVVYFV